MIDKTEAGFNSNPHLNLSVFNTLKKIFSNKFSVAIENHANSAKKNIEHIETALIENDADALEHAAHSLKGASAQFGAIVLSELAEQIEILAAKMKLEQAVKILPELKRERERVEKLMNDELKKTK